MKLIVENERGRQKLLRNERVVIIQTTVKTNKREVKHYILALT